MSGDLNIPTLTVLTPAATRAAEFISLSTAANTRRAYAADWRNFTAWCESKGAAALPASPETVALYLADAAADCKPSTLARRLAAISKAHSAAGFPSPASLRYAVVAAVLKGIRVKMGTRPAAKEPLMTADVRKLLAALPEGLLGIRDRAMLLVGFAGGLRRSELAELRVEQLKFTSDGLIVLIAHSKTDQAGGGEEVGVPYGSNPATCPVRSLLKWLETAGIREGPIFRNVDRHGHLGEEAVTGQAVWWVVRRYAQAAGLDPLSFGAHSLRSGCATQAAANGASEPSIQRQLRHASPVMSRRYIKHATVFSDNAATRLGL